MGDDDNILLLLLNDKRLTSVAVPEPQLFAAFALNEMDGNATFIFCVVMLLYSAFTMIVAARGSRLR